jgi:hypothetical protein
MVQGIYAYQWQTADNAAGPWANITVNGDQAEYSDVLTSAGVKYYRVIVDDLASGCGTMTSTPISDNSQSGSVSYCYACRTNGLYRRNSNSHGYSIEWLRKFSVSMAI